MALSPETTDALRQALDAVIAECGDDPEYADLINALQAAQAALPEGGEAQEESGEPSDDGDEYSFDHAQKRMTERRRQDHPAA